MRLIWTQCYGVYLNLLAVLNISIDLYFQAEVLVLFGS